MNGCFIRAITVLAKNVVGAFASDVAVRPSFMKLLTNCNDSISFDDEACDNLR